MGFPRLWGKVRLRQHTSRSFRATQLGPVIRGKDDAEREPILTEDGSWKSSKSSLLARMDAETTHTMVYYLLLLTGAYSFYRLLLPMTDFKELALVSFVAKK